MPKQVKTSKMENRRGENRLEGKGKKKPEKGVRRLYLYQGFSMKCDIFS
jgi:hypothetical protein